MLENRECEYQLADAFGDTGWHGHDMVFLPDT